MSDTIRLTGVRAQGTHGVLESEHHEPQPFVVDVTLEMDLEPAGASDDLADTVSYAEIADEIVAIVEGPHVDLIERLAGRIAEAVLTHRLVEAVEVTVHKPQAPIEVPFGDVAVTICRESSHQVVIALGANLGDAHRTLAAAVQQIGRIEGIAVDMVSDLVETDPVGGPEQPTYLNAVLVGRTRLQPRTLLRRLHEIEAAHGRVRDVRWGPRTLDLDLIQHGDPGVDDDTVCDSPDLTLPHPRAHERGFVLVPWLAADPSATLRHLGQPVAVAQLVAQMETSELGTGVRSTHVWQSATECC